MKIATKITALLMMVFNVLADSDTEKPGSGAIKFAQLGQDLPTPNVYRTASGAPGSQYWQQKVDYKIKVQLDETNYRITGSETIDYTNNSPDTLRYLWIQLDQNRFADNSISRLVTTSSEDRLSFNKLRERQSYEDHEHGYEITKVEDKRGEKLAHTIVDTMMRIDLPRTLKPGDKTSFQIDWQFNIIEEVAIGGRGGYERFSDNDTYTFFLAQWFPRLAAYTDYMGWQHKQFLGRGEFTLEFGDYDVEITVPADHIVSSTGSLQNPAQVLTETQRQRLSEVNNTKPTFIVTPEEALQNEAEGTTDLKTWHFKAENVRDFAWSSSRKFIWDVLVHDQPGARHEKVLAMSFYPNEAEPIWSRYSSHAVAHTMDVYSRFSFDYPYPVAQSVNTWKSGGMEYPMITFNGYRPTPPEEDEDEEDVADAKKEPADADADMADQKKKEPSYSRTIKYGLIGVIIHEIGHIYFPMTVNSDERQWTWMDEGLNSFLEYLAEQEWEEQFPAFRENVNVLDQISEYMLSEDQVPIMTNSESILQFGPNAYGKPTAALTVLRETVMGRELFDFAFKQYAERWMFKRPTPADFFRTMEDASGVDLDWFWRGWFYTTEHVDIAISDIREYKILTKDPDVDNPLLRQQWQIDHPTMVAEQRNRDAGIKLRIENYPDLKDLYNEKDRFEVSNKDRNSYRKYLKELEDWEKEVLERAVKADQMVYFVDFMNKGGLVSPLPIEINYKDGSSRELILPAEIWNQNANRITRLFIETKAIESVSLDEQHQTADTDYGNNRFPPLIRPSRLELYKRDRKKRDLMADLLVELKGDTKTQHKSKSVPLTTTN